MHLAFDQTHRWGVILAGGEGVRLKSLTRLISGEDTPKQFCPLLDGRTMLEQTIQRINRNICSQRMVYLLLNSHERFYSKQLRNIGARQMVVQPANRGTLPAIMASLVHIVRQDPNAVVGFFPADHYYAEEERFTAGVDLALAAAESNPKTVILLGVAANNAETEYGWIETASTMSSQSSHGLLKVKRFWEKPSARIAEELLEAGCVWNTFVMIGRAQAFLDVIRAASPDIYRVFEPLLELHPSQASSNLLDSVYQRVPTGDFSKLVLTASQDQLAVLCLGDVGWSDLGDPGRVMNVLAEAGDMREWMASWHTNAVAVGAGE